MSSVSFNSSKRGKVSGKSMEDEHYQNFFLKPYCVEMYAINVRSLPGYHGYHVKHHCFLRLNSFDKQAFLVRWTVGQPPALNTEPVKEKMKVFVSRTMEGRLGCKDFFFKSYHPKWANKDLSWSLLLGAGEFRPFSCICIRFHSTWTISTYIYPSISVFS